MKPEVKKAFDLITQATGELTANRVTHFQIQEALRIIESELTPKKEEPKK